MAKKPLIRIFTPVCVDGEWTEVELTAAGYEDLARTTEQRATQRKSKPKPKPKLRVVDPAEFEDALARGEITPSPPPNYRWRFYENRRSLRYDFPELPDEMIDLLAIGEIVSAELGISNPDEILALTEEAERWRQQQEELEARFRAKREQQAVDVAVQDKLLVSVYRQTKGANRLSNMARARCLPKSARTMSTTPAGFSAPERCRNPTHEGISWCISARRVPAPARQPRGCAPAPSPRRRGCGRWRPARRRR